MGYVSKEWLKEHGCQIFMYQKDDKGNEGVLPVNIDDLPEPGEEECDPLCKYHDDIEGCLFFFMGSGRPQDMPCMGVIR